MFPPPLSSHLSLSLPQLQANRRICERIWSISFSDPSFSIYLALTPSSLSFFKQIEESTSLSSGLQLFLLDTQSMNQFVQICRACLANMQKLRNFGDTQEGLYTQYGCFFSWGIWLGSETEERACFVEEVKCVGCLKCALLAEKTFDIESNYGRARVVAQWDDPEHKIQEAIEACPVNCISMVDRSNLAALEFLMSKQPRGSVRMSAGNTVGERVSNVFDDVNKFQTKFSDSMYKNSQQDSNETDLQREAIMTAIQAIRPITRDNPKGIYEQMVPKVRAHLQFHDDRGKLRFTGHSLGGSLALLRGFLG